jgi:hypothetical protein
MPRHRIRHATILSAVFLLPSALGEAQQPPSGGGGGLARPTILVTPALRETLVLTDNVDQEPDGDSALVSVTSAELGLSMRPAGQRISLLGDATFALTYDTDEEDLDLNALGLLLGTADVWNRTFFVDAALSGTRQLVSGSGRVSGTGRDSDDVADVYTAAISPYARAEIGNWADAELRYTHTQVLVDDDGDDGGDDGDGSIDYLGLLSGTGTRYTRFAVNTIVEAETSRSDGSADVHRQSVALGTIYTLTRQVAVLGTIGYDWVDSDDLTEDHDGVRWAAGLGLYPGPRSSLEFTLGGRFEEPSVNVLARYAITPTLQLTGVVSDGLETETGSLVGSSLSAQLDPLTGTLVQTATGLPVGLPGFATVGGIDDVAFVRRYQLTLSGFRGRNSYAANVVREERDFETEDDETVDLAFVSFGRQLRPDLSLGLGASYRETEEDGIEPDSTGWVGTVGLNYRYSPRISMSAGYSYSRQDSDDPGEEFVENAVVLELLLTF